MRYQTLLERMHFALSVRTRYQTLHEREHSASFLFERIANATRTYAFFSSHSNALSNATRTWTFCLDSVQTRINATRTWTLCFISVRTCYQTLYKSEPFVSILFECVIKCHTNANILPHICSNAFTNAARMRTASYPFEHVHERNTNATQYVSFHSSVFPMPCEFT